MSRNLLPHLPLDVDSSAAKPIAAGPLSGMMLSWGVSTAAHLSIALSLAMFVVAGNSGRKSMTLDTTIASSNAAESTVEVELPESVYDPSQQADELSQESTSASDSATVTVDTLSLPPIDADFPETKSDDSEFASNLFKDLTRPLPNLEDLAVDNSRASKANRDSYKRLLATATNERITSELAANRERAGVGEGNLDGDGAESESGVQTIGASFFGTRALGKRFVFIVDSSSSMNGLRWQVATRELIRTIHDLVTDTEFFVICFDMSAHPMFNQFPPKNKYLKNDQESLKRVERWISNFQTGPETYPASSLKMGIQMSPDAIFLLSDGVIRDDSIWLLREFNRNSETGEVIVPIHTVLLMSPMGQVPLQTIAVENGGTYRYITLEDLQRDDGSF